ncbi:MAG: hypothetical protein ABJA67_02840 [Chthonomonadales bacterium]
MSLDIYVGPLTRYYTGDWENVLARHCRENGIQYNVLRTTPDTPDPITEPAEVRELVHGWRSLTEANLSEHLSSGLSWPEEADGPYFTDRPNWEGYAGLLLLAAHTEFPDFAMPNRLPSEWDEDEAYLAAMTPDIGSRFSSVYNVQLWLPCPFAFTFQAEDGPGNDTWMGSSFALRDQLCLLNDETYKGSTDNLARWMKEGFSETDSFETCARFGLSMFLHLAQLSVKHRLPMKLDF